MSSAGAPELLAERFLQMERWELEVVGLVAARLHADPDARRRCRQGAEQAYRLLALRHPEGPGSRGELLTRTYANFARRGLAEAYAEDVWELTSWAWEAAHLHRADPELAAVLSRPWDEACELLEELTRTPSCLSVFLVLAAEDPSSPLPEILQTARHTLRVL